MERSTWWALALVGTAMLLHAPSRGARDFVLDDTPIVETNPVVRQERLGDALTTPWWPAPPGSPVPPNWRPLVTASFVVDHARSGARPGRSLDPAPFHTANVLLYGFVVWCVWLLARRLCGSAAAALAATALFAVHPAHVEAVAPLVGRTDLLATAAVVGACVAWWRFAESDERRWQWIAAGCFAIGLGAKESAAPLLLLLPALDVLVRGVAVRDLWGRAALRYLPLVGVLAAWLLVRAAVLGGSALVHPDARPDGVGEWLFGFGRNGAWSALLSVWPAWTHHIVTTLPMEAPITYPPPATGVGTASLVFTLALCLGWLACWRRSGVAAFCWAAAVATWLPTSGLLPIGAGVALRFLFLPSVFICIGAVLALECGVRRSGSAGPTVRLAVVTVLAVVGGAVTLQHQRAWQSHLDFHRAVLAQVPDCYESLATAGGQLAGRGQLAEARPMLERAVTLAPRRGPAWRNLLASYTFGPGTDVEAAVTVAERWIAADPDAWEPRYTLMVIATDRGDRAVALTRLREAYARAHDPATREQMERNFRELGEPVPPGAGAR